VIDKGYTDLCDPSCCSWARQGDEELMSYWMDAHPANAEFLARAVIHYAGHVRASEHWSLLITVVLGFCEAVRKPNG